MNKRFLEWECEKKIAKKYFKGSCEDKGAEDIYNHHLLWEYVASKQRSLEVWFTEAN
jgi:hypothetical protein